MPNTSPLPSAPSAMAPALGNPYTGLNPQSAASPAPTRTGAATTAGVQQAMPADQAASQMFPMPQPPQAPGGQPPAPQAPPAWQPNPQTGNMAYTMEEGGPVTSQVPKLAYAHQGHAVAAALRYMQSVPVGVLPVAIGPDLSRIGTKSAGRGHGVTAIRGKAHGRTAGSCQSASTVREARPGKLVSAAQSTAGAGESALMLLRSHAKTVASAAPLPGPRKSALGDAPVRARTEPWTLNGFEHWPEPYNRHGHPRAQGSVAGIPTRANAATTMKVGGILTFDDLKRWANSQFANTGTPPQSALSKTAEGFLAACQERGCNETTIRMLAKVASEFDPAIAEDLAPLVKAAAPWRDMFKGLMSKGRGLFGAGAGAADDMARVARPSPITNADRIPMPPAAQAQMAQQRATGILPAAPAAPAAPATGPAPLKGGLGGQPAGKPLFSLPGAADDVAQAAGPAAPSAPAQAPGTVGGGGGPRGAAPPAPTLATPPSPRPGLMTPPMPGSPAGPVPPGLGRGVPTGASGVPTGASSVPPGASSGSFMQRAGDMAKQHPVATAAGAAGVAGVGAYGAGQVSGAGQALAQVQQQFQPVAEQLGLVPQGAQLSPEEFMGTVGQGLEGFQGELARLPGTAAKLEEYIVGPLGQMIGIDQEKAQAVVAAGKAGDVPGAIKGFNDLLGESGAQAQAAMDAEGQGGNWASQLFGSLLGEDNPITQFLSGLGPWQALALLAGGAMALFGIGSSLMGGNGGGMALGGLATMAGGLLGPSLMQGKMDPTIQSMYDGVMGGGEPQQAPAPTGPRPLPPGWQGPLPSGQGRVVPWGEGGGPVQLPPGWQGPIQPGSMGQPAGGSPEAEMAPDMMGTNPQSSGAM